MRTVTMLVISVVLIALAAGYALWLYPQLPEMVPTHWNAAGQVDGWGPRGTAAFMTPGIMLIFLALMLVLPLISPQRFKVEGFRGTWNAVVALLMVLFAFIHVAMLQAALHPQVDVGRLLIAGICLFIAAMGLFMPKVKRNFWMGVRTPWTLASEEVWTATHRLAGWTMGIGGLVGAVLVLAGVPPLAGFVFVIAAALYPVFYSLWLYKRLEREGKLE
jgi:uncharacterized membrane protein